MLVDGLAVKVVVVGEDFHFGSHREGNVRLLEELRRRATTSWSTRSTSSRAPTAIDEPISSTAIRRALAGGEVELAARMLGRPHEVRGTVVVGDQRGRLLGFPTANVEVPNACRLPADGVYAGWYERPDGDVHPCAINLGRRPTFYEHADHSLLEAHLLDFDGDLYGERAEVRFAHFLRSERKFDGIDADQGPARRTTSTTPASCCWATEPGRDGGFSETSVLWAHRTRVRSGRRRGPPGQVRAALTRRVISAATPVSTSNS